MKWPWIPGLRPGWRQIFFSFFKLSVFFLSLIFSQSHVFAADLPFTDVPKDAYWYQDLKNMYEGGVIPDTPDHLFRPDGLLPRDEFIGIVVGVSCKRCVYPTISDILKYRDDPFTDVTKQNRYFYCISYAKEQGMVQGYILDQSGKTSCQDGKVFDTVPFCPANNISRIEAAAVLLRQANLWSETLNSSAYERRMNLPDVDSYWYGYAQKAIDTGLIRLGAGNKIAPHEQITRREFVIMASKIYALNLCQIQPKKEKNDFSSTIYIFDKEKKSCPANTQETVFPNLYETVYDLKWYGKGVGAIMYDWELLNTNTNEKRYLSGACQDNYDFVSPGVWVVKLTVTDSIGQTSTSYRQVTILKQKGYDLSVAIQWVPIDGYEPLLVNFTSTVGGGIGPFTYQWSFDDGGYSGVKHPTHLFKRSWVYTVVLMVQDTATGNVGFAQLVVHVIPDPDRDHDGIINTNDRCPDVYGPTTFGGCPRIVEYPIPALTVNQCVLAKISNAGAIAGWAQCTSCPCAYSLDFVSQIRSCDIVFPTISSPDKKTIYSRGKIFQVQ